MKGYFAVDIDCLNSNLDKDYRFLFKATGMVDSAELVDALTASLRRVTYPDVIAIVCSPKESDHVTNVCQQDTSVMQALKRASDKTCVVILQLCKNGNFSLVCFIINENQDVALQIDDNFSEIVYKTGLGSLFAKEKVLARAPAGFIFLKPSNTRSRYFIKVENALSESENVYFLACSLLKIIHARENDATEPIEVIFIDTMAISSLAYTLRDLYVELYENKAKPRVVSFHSYSGISTVNLPLPGCSLCIISASFSMNMQDKWLEYTNCLESEVITLLTFKNKSEHSERALYSLPDSLLEPKKEEHEGLRDIRILGEMFSPEEIEPKQVLLNLKSHRIAEWSKKAPLLSGEKVLSAFRKPQNSDSPKPIFIDGSKVFKHYQEDVKKYVLDNVPVSTKYVIHQDDESSEILARFCAKLIDEHLKIQVDVVGPDKITDDMIQDQNADGVLITAAVIGRGEALNSISRDLRGKHKGTRRILVVAQIAESKTAITLFKKNIEQSPSGQLNKVNILQSLAVGMTEFTDLNKELNLFSTIGGNIPEPVQDRIDKIRKNDTLDSEFFLPSSVYPHCKLTLRPGFVFWEGNYQDTLDHSAAVLSTVASCLQHAREAESIPDADRLYSSAFQQVVLDPENFSRFNDGIIQAALLRASYPSELDYSSIPDASKRLGRFLQRLFQNYQRKQGEASLEFAFALAIGKLKLTEKYHKDLVEFCKDKVQGEDEWCKLLQSLLHRSINLDTPQTPF